MTTLSFIARDIPSKPTPLITEPKVIITKELRNRLEESLNGPFAEVKWSDDPDELIYNIVHAFDNK